MNHCWVMQIGRQPYCAKCGERAVGGFMPFSGCSWDRQANPEHRPFQNDMATHRVTLDVVEDVIFRCRLAATRDHSRGPSGLELLGSAASMEMARP